MKKNHKEVSGFNRNYRGKPKLKQKNPRTTIKYIETHKEDW